MKSPKYPARNFKLWLENMRDNKGVPISKTEAARLLGCGRNMVLHWEKNGAPHYIGLACRELWRTRNDAMNEPLPPRARTRQQIITAEMTPRQKLNRLKSIRWTKASA